MLASSTIAAGIVDVDCVPMEDDGPCAIFVSVVQGVPADFSMEINRRSKMDLQASTGKSGKISPCRAGAPPVTAAGPAVVHSNFSRVGALRVPDHSRQGGRTRGAETGGAPRPSSARRGAPPAGTRGARARLLHGLSLHGRRLRG